MTRAPIKSEKQPFHEPVWDALTMIGSSTKSLFIPFEPFFQVRFGGKKPFGKRSKCFSSDAMTKKALPARPFLMLSFGYVLGQG